MNNLNRRALIIGAGFATAAPALVRAETMLEIPGNPLTARGLFAAEKWAAEGFGELPAARIAFADGQTTKWSGYTCMARTKDGVTTHAVAIEVVTTDQDGRRFITSVPVGGVKIDRDLATVRKRQQAQQRIWAERWASGDWPF